ncbi:hypothetical protein SDC9_152441 [bioreactor metagenome]|uniref:Glycosyl hydrolases family 38 C-terminal beta sandwich domain-containing protein n=1 Tax=bioreactor metagenome TaxID=1076179 RepID=A0A645ET26_9ZZZZ
MLLVFHTRVLWNEDRKLFQTSFPVNVFADSAIYDIQYGFVRRPMHTNTSWDFAKFETPAHRYVDVSEHAAGAAVLNDCKYAYTVRNSEIILSLLRSARYPDYDADRGEQEFSYGFLPHENSLEDSGVIEESAQFNRPPAIFCGFDASSATALITGIESDGGISLEVVKHGERKNALVLRFAETRGRKSCGRVRFHCPADITETDLLEWEERDIAANTTVLELNLSPFELKTFLVYSRG